MYFASTNLGSEIGRCATPWRLRIKKENCIPAASHQLHSLSLFNKDYVLERRRDSLYSPVEEVKPCPPSLVHILPELCISRREENNENAPPHRNSVWQTSIICSGCTGSFIRVMPPSFCSLRQTSETIPPRSRLHEVVLSEIVNHDLSTLGRFFELKKMCRFR